MSDKESGLRVDKHFHCIANEFDDKEPCKSSDALSVYEKEVDGKIIYDAFCFSCTQHFTKEEVANSTLADELGLEGGEIKGEKKLLTKPKVEPLTKEQITQLKESVGFSNQPYRKILPETLMFFGHMVKRNSAGVAKEVWYPETEEGKVTGFKIRILPKYWNKIGRTGKPSELSGQFRFKGNAKRVLYVAGENDKCAAYQALLKYGVHVVAPTCGEGNAADQAAAQFEFFDKYEEIYIGMDSDEAGIKAMEKIVEVLPKAKLKIVTWSEKDPHQMLEAGRAEQISRDFWNARDYVSTGIKSGAEAMAEVKEFLTAPKLPLPPHMHRIQDAHRGGLKSSGFIGHIIADTSVGKTFVTDTLLNYWIPKDDLVPVIVSIERTAGEFMADLLSIYLSKNLTWFKEGQDAVDYLEQPEVAELCNSFIYDSEGKQRFYVIDERDGSLEILQNKMELAAAKYGTKLFIIDPLTDILRALGNDVQDTHMLWQKQQKKKGWMILNVLHTRKPPADKDGKTRPVTEYDAYGSSSFVQSSDFNWVLNRNKMAEDSVERNTMTVDIPKVRGGTTGRAAELLYDVQTRRHYDKEDFLSNNVRTVNPEYVPPVEEPPIVEYDDLEVVEISY